MKKQIILIFQLFHHILHTTYHISTKSHIISIKNHVSSAVLQISLTYAHLGQQLFSADHYLARYEWERCITITWHYIHNRYQSYVTYSNSFNTHAIIIHADMMLGVPFLSMLGEKTLTLGNMA